MSNTGEHWRNGQQPDSGVFKRHLIDNSIDNSSQMNHFRESEIDSDSISGY